MTATDLDMTATAICPAVSTMDGTRLIPATALRDASASKTDFQIESLEANSVMIQIGHNAAMNFAALDVAEFPPCPGIPASARALTFPAMQFISALQSVANAMSTDASRYVLNGVCVDQSADGLRLVATDGRRMHIAPMSEAAPDAATLAKVQAAEAERLSAHAALDAAYHELAEIEKTSPPTYTRVNIAGHMGRELYEKTASEAVNLAESRARACKHAADLADELAQSAKASVQIIIPAKAVKAILAMPIDAKNPGTLTLSSWIETIGEAKHPYANITAGDYSLTTKLIDGNYPNYRQVIPVNCLREVVLPVGEFQNAVKQAATATTEKSRFAKVTLDKNRVTVSGKSDIGEAAATVSVNYSEPGLAIAIMPDYLLSVCESATIYGEQVTAQFVDELSPAVFRLPNGWQAVVMPGRLS